MNCNSVVHRKFFCGKVRMAVQAQFRRVAGADSFIMISLRAGLSLKILFFCAVIGLICTARLSVSEAQTVNDENIRRAAQEVLSNSSLQTTMPDREAMPERSDPPTVPKWVAKTIGIIVIAGVIIGVLIILYLLVRSLMDRRLRGGGLTVKTEKEQTTAPVAPVKVKALDEMPLPALADAEKLAKEGFYTDAIHILLLLAIDDIRKRSQEILHPSLTGREIFGKVKLNTDVAAVVKYILQTSERAYFGQKKADEGDYRTCRDRYQQFQSAFNGKGAQ